MFAAGAGLALLARSCTATRLAPGRCAPAWRFRAPPPPPRSCASTPTKARSATCASRLGTRSGPPRPLRRCGDLAGRPPSLDPGRVVDAAAGLDLALPDPIHLSSNLKTCLGQGDPLSAASKTAALTFSVFPDARAAEAEILALWVFDITLALRLRRPRPLPLIAAKVLDPVVVQTLEVEPSRRRNSPPIKQRGPHSKSQVRFCF